MRWTTRCVLSGYVSEAKHVRKCTTELGIVYSTLHGCSIISLALSHTRVEGYSVAAIYWVADSFDTLFWSNYVLDIIE